MSLLFRDELRIVLSPRKVSLVRHRGRLKPSMVEQREVFCATAAPSDAPWLGALECLERGLKEAEGGRSNATVVLSNHFVRYALVPWSDQISDADEEQAFIRHCFSKIYGEEAKHWALRMSPGGYGETRVASAIDQEMLDGLERVLAAHSSRLVSVQPYFMAAFNQWRHQLSASVVWFVLAEPGRLCVSLLEHGRWSCLRGVQVGKDWQEALRKLLEREYLLSESGSERGKVCLYAPDDKAEATLPGWTVHRLGANPHSSSNGEVRLAMNMSE